MSRTGIARLLRDRASGVVLVRGVPIVQELDERTPDVCAIHAFGLYPRYDHVHERAGRRAA